MTNTINLILKTDRLILKIPEFKDAISMRDIANDKDVSRYLTNVPYPYTLEDAQKFIKTCRQNRTFDFGIFLQNNNRFIGMVGLAISNIHNHATLGYWLGKKYWSKGYASEAALRLIEFGFDELDLHRIASHHFHKNPVSGFVMQKIGLKYEGTRKQHFKKDGEYFDIVDYGLLREDFRS